MQTAPTECRWGGAVDTSFRVIAYDGDLRDTLIVTVTVGSVNDPPVITSASIVEATEDVYFKYVASATDPDGPTLSWNFDRLPTWLSSDADSAFGTPLEGEVDTSFRVIASDGDLNDTLIVTVPVGSVNDPPVAAADIIAATGEDSVLVLYVLVNDSDPELDRILIQAVIDSGRHGLAVKDEGDTTITYTPEADYFGPDTVQYVITDGQYTDTASVYLTVLPVNDRPVITSIDTVVAKEDEYFVYHATATDVENDSLSWTFDWHPGWLQSDADSVFGSPLEGAVDTSFRAIVADSTLSDTVVVNLSVIAVNDPPVVVHAGGITVLEGDTVAVTSDDLQVLDADNSNDQLQFAFEAQPTELTGEFRLSGVALADSAHFTQADIDSGRISFAHDGSETTLDSIGFSISDSAGATAHIAYFPITVIPVNDPPEQFALLVPADGDIAEIVNDSLLFVWESSVDIEGDTLVYHFHLYGPGYDTTIAGLTDTALVLTGMAALTVDSLYTWYVDVLDGTDTTDCLADYQFRMPSVLALDPLAFIPAAFALHQNYPNPFNPTTTIQYDLPIATDVHLTIYDILGREVVRLVDRQMEAGYYRVVWNARDASGREVSTGIYIVMVVAPEFRKNIKMLLLR